MRNPSALLLTATLLLLPATPAAGQIKLGVNGGANLASTLVHSGHVSEHPDKINSLTRMSLGASAEFPVSGIWSFQVTGSYSQKGAEWEFDAGFDDDLEGFGTVGLTLELDYIELAALGAARFPLFGNRVSAHLLAGPAFALRATCNVTVDLAGLAFGGDCDDEEVDIAELRSFDVGLAGGAGIEIGLTDALGVSVGGLFTQGLVGVTTGNEDDPMVQHQVLTLRAGLVYTLPAVSGETGARDRR